MGTINAKDLRLNIQDKLLLKGLTFSLEEGESMILVGESGSGKTLLSQLLIGKRPTDAEIAGTLKVNGKNILAYGPKDWEKIRGRQIAYIAQNPHGLFNSMQTIESHGLETFQGLLGLEKEEARTRFKKALAQFQLKDLDHLLKSYPFELSGGMLQRVMIAMMMELEPEFLIADEPTSALDSFNTQRVVDMLRISKNKGTQLLLITHDYSLLKDLGEKILLLRQGEQMEFGRVEDLMDHAKTPYGQALLAKREYKRYQEVAHED